jgi:phosphohistidine swiveling domain-containing protein
MLSFCGKINYPIIYNNIIVKKYNKNNKAEDYKDKIIYLDQSINSILDYFPYIKGVILKEGSVLSHVAIVCRELKIPSIINIDEEFSNFFKDEILVSIEDNCISILNSKNLILSK